MDALDVEQLIKLRNIKLFNTLIVKFVYDVLGLNSNLVEPLKKYHDEYVRGGFVQNREKNSGKCENTQKGLQFNELQLESIARIEQLLKAHNTKLIYVSAPITNDFKRGHPEYEMFEAFMKSKSPYYNFSSFELLKDSDHFIDCDHLNQSGVNIFNDSLLRINIFNLN